MTADNGSIIGGSENGRLYRGDLADADPPAGRVDRGTGDPVMSRSAVAVARGLAAWQSGTEDATAVSWFRRAAAQGNGTAAYFLSVAYAEGRGVRRNTPIAQRLLQRAADLGDAEAEYFVGLGFTNGQGAEKEKKRTLNLKGPDAKGPDAKGPNAKTPDTKSADAPSPESRQNDALAARWYGKAADQGDPPAQYMLGVSYALGLGLPKDPVMAYKWIWLAARTRYRPAEAALTALDARIAPKDRAGAIARARAWHRSRGNMFADKPTVRFVQVVLAELGFDPGPIDGEFGPKTRQAIAAYETTQGQPGSGRLTGVLLKRLEVVAAEPAEQVGPHFEGVW